MGISVDETLADGSRGCDAPLAASDSHVQLGQGQRVGRYLVLDRVGMGGMGVVYAAYDPELDRKVAIKLVRTSSEGEGARRVRARLLREAQAMARLSHPNVVTVHDVGTVDAQVFVAMEFIEGPTLRKWLDAQPRSWEQVVEILLRAGRGLEAAHALDLVHRDFKPENVMIGSDGRVVVLDFGLVRAGSDAHTDASASLPSRAPGDATLTQTGAVLGTPSYMAPEQLLGADVDGRCDQFSFCVTLYESLYGERPFAGETIAELTHTTMSGELREGARVSAVPRWLRAVVLRGLSQDPAQRYASMSELLAELSRSPGRVELATKISLALVVVLVAVAVALGVLRSRRVAHATRVCTQAAEVLSETWSDEARAALEQSLVATGSPLAAGSYERASAWLDAWTARWMAQRRAVCLRARVEGELSELRHAQAQACFDEQREQLAAMLEVFSAPSVDMVPSAAKVAASLSELESCADEQVLAHRAAPGGDAHAPHVTQVRRHIARATALYDAGSYARGLSAATAAVSLATTLDGALLEAEARLLCASFHAELGDYTQAVGELREGFKLALAAGDDALAAKLAIMLLRVHGYHLAQTSEGLAWADVADALLVRLGRTEGLDAAQLANNVALVHELLGEYERAESSHRRALALRQQVLGAEHPEAGHSLANLGIIALLQGDLDAALGWHLRALELRSRGLGPGHPDVARSHSNLGRVYLVRGELDEALSHFHESFDTLELSVGEHHRVSARVLDYIGRVHLQRRELTVALGYLRRAHALQLALLGAQHHETAQTTFDIGRALQLRGELDEAFVHIELAAVAFETQLGPEHRFMRQVRDAAAELCAADYVQACALAPT